MHIFVLWHTLCRENCSRLSAPTLNSTVPCRMRVSFMRWRSHWAVVWKAKLCNRPKCAHLIPAACGTHCRACIAFLQSEAQALRQQPPSDLVYVSKGQTNAEVGTWLADVQWVVLILKKVSQILVRLGTKSGGIQMKCFVRHWSNFAIVCTWT